uniref:GOLD domain-containing protein n=1 Tax=Pyramimonas obovata TaxID=1411642 RepID=A0A7S0WU23_9CHLO|mmetsp:Transcript_4161/g.8560  ORF Transcript_4161/g.8560 Transcript_4161/m.8560 type:complete len:239 (+) Transcript_4161:14-730(+)
MKASLYQLFLLSLCLVGTLSYTITVKEGQTECLYELFSKDSLLPGENEDTVATEISIAFTIKEVVYMRAKFPAVVDFNVSDPHGNLVYEKKSVGDEDIRFYAEGAGHYSMCFHNKGDRTHGVIPYDKRFVNINIAYFTPLHKVDDPSIILTPRGNEEYRGSQLLDTESISAAHSVILELKGQVALMLAEQKRAKKREARHRKTIESTNSRTLMWAIFEFMAFAGVNCLQVTILRRFFR